MKHRDKVAPIHTSGIKSASTLPLIQLYQNKGIMMECLLLLCFFPPMGFVISILTERLASRNILTIALPRVWTTLVKCASSYLVWNHLIFFTWPSGSGFGAICHLPTLSLLVFPSHGEFGICDTNSSIKITSMLFARCFLFYIGARLGATLQPVGLTGGIACGKSTVSKLLREPSKESNKDAFAMIDVDLIAHDILVPGKMGSYCGYKRVVEAFAGADLFTESKKEVPFIDRRKLGDIIFRDTGKRRALNRITHPLISKIMMMQIVQEGLCSSKTNTSIVSVDIPLLYEVGLVMRLLFGIKIVIACKEDVQLKRLMERNRDLTKEQCQDRIDSQIPVSKKAKMADIVIWNNGSMDDLSFQVSDARSEVLARTHAFLGVSLARLILVAGLLTAVHALLSVIVLSKEPGL